MVCPRCRAPVVGGSSFCNRCGAPLSPFAAASQPKRSRAPLVFGVLALVVLVLGGLAALFAVLWLENEPIRCSEDKKCDPVPQGGGKVVVETSRDIVMLEVPKGAVDADTTFGAEGTATPSPFKGSGLPAEPLVPVAMPLELTPSGKAFHQPVVVTMSFDESRVPVGTSPKEMRIAVSSDDEKTWEMLAPIAVDTKQATVTFAMKHFTKANPVFVPRNPDYLRVKNAEDNPNFVHFFGLDGRTYTRAEQEARIGARCAEMKAVLARYPNLFSDPGKVPREAFTRFFTYVPFPGWNASFATLIRSYDPPEDLSNNPYADATERHGPPDANGKSYEQVFLDEIRASDHPLRLAEVLKLALDTTGGDYPLAVLTAHNALKNVTYKGRVDGKTVGPEQGDIAAKLEHLRQSPGARDKMGPWYHAFGVLMVGALLSGKEAGGLVSVEHGTRVATKYIPFISTSPMDPEKAAIDECAVSVAQAVPALPPPSGTTTGRILGGHHHGDAGATAGDGGGADGGDDLAELDAAAAFAADDAAGTPEDYPDAADSDWPGLYKGKLVGTEVAGRYSEAIDVPMRAVVVRTANGRLVMTIDGFMMRQSVDVGGDAKHPHASGGQDLPVSTGKAHLNWQADFSPGTIQMTTEGTAEVTIDKVTGIGAIHAAGPLHRVGDAHAAHEK